MSNCNICGRKTQIVQKIIVKSGKYKGWVEMKHRCEVHGIQDLKVRPAKQGE